MKKYFYSIIVAIVCSFIFQACVPQQLEVNPGFAKKASSETPTPKSPIPKLAEGPEAQKPIWEIGYKWEYEWERPDSSGTLTRKVIREEIFDGIPCFVVKIGALEVFYTKDVLGPVATKKKGNVIWKTNAPIQRVAWPLKVGRKWNAVFKYEKVQEESSTNYDFEVVVAKLEEVTVPAGKFKAFKTEVYFSYSGNLESEWWYSPKVKGYVKFIRHIGSGTRPLEYRLKSYTVD